jgi:hypothetical protein
MIITVEKVMALKPCEDWTEDRVRSYGDSVSPAALAQILLLIDPKDARWLLARLLPRKGRIEWACRCDERALSIWEAAYPDDDRPRAAIEAAQSGYTANAATTRAARAAANAAALAAYAAAARAAYAATTRAARAAANATANAAYTAETEWQIREACKMLEAVE